MHRLEFNKHEMTYLNDYIKFADAKAGVMLGINGVLVKIVLDMVQGKKLYPIQDILGFMGALLLLVGAFFLVSVVLPRTNFKARKGIINWDNITQYEKASDYVQDIKPLDLETINEKLAEQNYYLAKTASQKYRFLVYGFWLSAVGAILVVIRIVVNYV